MKCYSFHLLTLVSDQVSLQYVLLYHFIVSKRILEPWTGQWVTWKGLLCLCKENVEENWHFLKNSEKNIYHFVSSSIVLGKRFFYFFLPKIFRGKFYHLQSLHAHWLGQIKIFVFPPRITSSLTFNQAEKQIKEDSSKKSKTSIKGLLKALR